VCGHRAGGYFHQQFRFTVTLQTSANIGGIPANQSSIAILIFEFLKLL
jgi:hypothetical protein